MSRIKGGVTSHRRHKKILKQAKGTWGSSHVRIRVAKQTVMKGLQHAYEGRRLRKRDFRSLWIQRINAAARIQGLPYNKLIAGLKVAGVVIDRKMLAEIAVNDPAVFGQLAEIAKATISKPS
ncbi:MAG: 50S ribosomal protein L20 [bacterium]